MRMTTGTVVFPHQDKKTAKRIDMHRWLCTTAPLLIGSLAAGTIHAASAADACANKHHGSRTTAGYVPEDTPERAGAIAIPVSYRPDRTDRPDREAERMRLCIGCHDGTVARINIDAHDPAVEQHLACGPARQ